MTESQPAQPSPRVRRLPTWLRKGVLGLGVLVIVEYLVVPELLGAGKNVHLLGNLEPLWLLLAVALEIGSWISYAACLGVLLHDRIPLSHLVRLVLTTTGLSHVLPGGAAGGAGLGFEQLTSDGIPRAEGGTALATEAIGSALVLNLLLLAALLITIPLAGVHPVYVVVALLGLVVMITFAALIYFFTAGEDRAVKLVRGFGRRFPRIGEGRAEQLVRQIGSAVSSLATDHPLVRRAALWSALNWLLDASALWCCFAALGHYLNPIELFAAYGIANVLAVIPLTPGGLGVVEASATALVVSFGTAGAVASLGVLGWHLMNFWLPIPLGGIAYLVRLAPLSPLHPRRA